MALKDALIAASPVLLGMGQQLSGRNPMGIQTGVAMMNAEAEKTQRKANIEGLLQSMQLSQQKRDFLSMLPFEQQAPILWDLMNPKPMGGGRAPTQAEIASAYAASLGGMPETTQTPTGGGYSMGAPVEVGAPVAASGGLSLGRPAAESPAPSTTSGLSFGNLQPKTSAPTDPYAQLRSNIMRDLPRIQADALNGVPGAQDTLNNRLSQLKALEVLRPAEVDSPIAALEARAVAAGLEPGTAEYRNFMLTNGRNDGLIIESDGQGGFRMVQGAAAGSAKPFNEQQSKDNVFVTRARGAIEVLEPIAGALTGRMERAAEMDPTGLARELQSPEFQVAKQAGDEFLQAILRKDTGAAITEPEQYLYGRTYLPQPGDGPEVLLAKSEARKRAINAIEAGMSPAQMIAVEKALGEVTVPQDKKEETKAKSSIDYSGMTMDDLLKNVPTTEEDAAEWNKRWEALQ